MSNYNKVCNIEDFEELRNIRQKACGRDILYRKDWEVAMAIKCLSELGKVHSDSVILGIGAGTEDTTFYFSNIVKQVFCTDMYLAPGVWSEYANPSIMINPTPDRDLPFNKRRIVMQHMNALDLWYEDNTFDAIYSSGAIEHFGTHDDIRQSVREMYRVLKPGGVASISTEYKLSGDGNGFEDVMFFSQEQIDNIIVSSMPWILGDPIDYSISNATLETKQEPHKVPDEQMVYPHIISENYPYTWNSIHLCLIKPT